MPNTDVSKSKWSHIVYDDDTEDLLFIIIFFGIDSPLMLDCSYSNLSSEKNNFRTMNLRLTNISKKNAGALIGVNFSFEKASGSLML